MMMGKAEDIGKVVKLVGEVARRNGVSDAFFVGGYPRTIAMGEPLSEVHDLDLATASVGKAAQLAGLVAEASGDGGYEILHRTMSVRLTVLGLEMDFQGPMENDAVLPFLHEAGIEASPLARNIYSRDFTINSLAMPVTEPILIDLTRRAMRDIEEERIASVMPPEKSVPGNPLMITRAIRFSYKYGFEIEPGLWKAMRASAGRLRKALSPERLAIEALVLSKYKPMEALVDLGMEWLAEPSLVAAGEELAKE